VSHSDQVYEPRCPLCSSSNSAAVQCVQYNDIWNWLEQEWGAQFSQSTIDQHYRSDQLDLRACGECGIHFWYPVVAGSPAFYRELTSSAAGYYNENKWEFEAVKQGLQAHFSVLDVACGSGAFIRAAQDKVQRAIGIDTNPAAVKQAEQSGATVYETAVADFSETHREQFDVVTAFQVLEHLDNIMPFVEAAYRCVAPGGLLYVSVPNRGRRLRTEFEALDHPPHHITKWGARQLHALAEQLGAELLGIEYEKMDNRQIISALRQRDLPAVLPERLPARDLLIKAFSKLLLTPPLSMLMRSNFMQQRKGLYGHTVLAVLRKRPAAAAWERVPGVMRHDVSG